MAKQVTFRSKGARISAANPSANAAPAPSEAPLLFDLIRMGAAEPPKIAFRGWSPGLGWEGWVWDMAGDDDIVRMWRKAGIEDAILGSVTSVKPDHHALEALIGFWSPTARTFVFPWGEAAFTLEDACVLGNLPIRGSRLDRELTDKEEELRIRLFVEKEKIRELHPKAKLSRKVTLEIWLDWFIDLRGEDELKYLGFLGYWLTKNVIPVNPSGEVPNVVFGLAARLSGGDRIALAPVVTANIFHDLSRITKMVLNKKGKRVSNKIDLWTPFWLLQVWIWERFESLRPFRQDTVLSTSRSRISRWGRRKSSSKYDEAIHIFQEERSYTWRPYSKNTYGWKEPCWYHHESRRIRMSEGMPDWMDDFLAVIWPSTLQGFYGDNIVSSEKYQPHRIARQFGYDQAIPHSKDPLASLWVANNVCRVGDKIYIPEITRSGNPRGEYLAWWQKYRSQYQKALHDYATQAAGAEEDCTQETKENEKDLVAALPNIRKDIEAPKSRSRHMEKENNENSDLLVEQGSNQRRQCKEENDQFLNISRKKDDLNPEDKLKRHDNIILESFIDRMECNSGRKRKLEEKETIIRREGSAALVEDIAVIDVDIQEVVDYEEDRRLVDELEEFQRCGLLSEWGPSSPELEIEDNGRQHSSSNIRGNEDPYGQEAVRMYPMFFELIPQKPHYRGFLDKNVREDIRRDLYLSKWYKLVDLMSETLETSCETPASELGKLMQEAQRFEGYGFNVKHIIARLKEPHARLKRLKEAKIKLEEARIREHQAREMQTLKRHINDLGSKLKVIEKKLEDSQGAFGLIQQENTLDIMTLRKEVEDAETNLRAVERDVEAMSVLH